jgi:hypothetical protein
VANYNRVGWAQILKLPRGLHIHHRASSFILMRLLLQKLNQHFKIETTERVVVAATLWTRISGVLGSKLDDPDRFLWFSSVSPCECL